MIAFSPLASLLAALTAQLAPPPPAPAPAGGFLELLAEVEVPDEEPSVAPPEAKDGDDADGAGVAWAALLPTVFAEPPPPPLALDAPPADEQLEAPSGVDLAVASPAREIRVSAGLEPVESELPQDSMERPASATHQRPVEAPLPLAMAVAEKPAPVPAREPAPVEIAPRPEEPRPAVAPAVPREPAAEWTHPDRQVPARPVPQETAVLMAGDRGEERVPARPVPVENAAPAAGEGAEAPAPARRVPQGIAAPVADEQRDAQAPTPPVRQEMTAVAQPESADVAPLARVEPGAPPLERATPEHRPPVPRPESAAPVEHPELPPDVRPAPDRRMQTHLDAPAVPAVKEPARVQLAFAARLRPAPQDSKPASGTGVDRPAEAPGEDQTPPRRTTRAAAPEAMAERPPQQREMTWIQPARDTEAAAPERQSGVEPKPAASRSAAPRRESPLPAPVARDIRLEIGSPERKVEVRLVERGGDVHLAVRTPDSRLADGLREQLPQLSARLEQSGFRADEWRAAEAGAPERRVHVDAAAGGSADARQHGQPQDGRQDRREGEPRAPREGEPETPRNKEKGNAFAWLMESLR